ncbi:MAG: HAD family acid phosphatase [Hyphomonas sp.]
MRVLAVALVFALAGCVTAPAPQAVELSPGVAWVVAEDGWADEAEAVFAEATVYVQAIAAQQTGSGWAVVLDLDETVLNNVQYQVSRERISAPYTPESWYAWTQQARATLVPGAAEFLKAVYAAGGHAAFVTNRNDKEQLATENNLAALGVRRGVDFHVLLTRTYPTARGEKDERFALVPAMLAAQGFPDVEVVAFVGDNVGDKPAEPGDWQFFCIDQGAMYGAPCAAVPGPGR